MRPTDTESSSPVTLCQECQKEITREGRPHYVAQLESEIEDHKNAVIMNREENQEVIGALRQQVTDRDAEIARLKATLEPSADCDCLECTSKRVSAEQKRQRDASIDRDNEVQSYQEIYGLEE